MATTQTVSVEVPEKVRFITCEYCDSKLAVQRNATAAYTEVVERLEKHTRKLSDNVETIKRAIEIGAGVSILPAPTVAREQEAGTLATVGLAGQQLSRPLGIIHRRDYELSETAQRFVKLLLSHADDSDTTSSVATPGRRAAPHSVVVG